MSLAVASRYARALVDILMSPAPGLTPDLALAQLRLFHSLQQDSTDLRNILTSPAVGAARKKAVVERLAPMVSLSSLIKNFIFVLIDHRRIAMLPEVIGSIESQLDERMGIARAQITSARPLDAEQQAQVQAALAKLTGKQVLGQYGLTNLCSAASPRELVHGFMTGRCAVNWIRCAPVWYVPNF